MLSLWLRLATRSRPSSRLLGKGLGFVNWDLSTGTSGQGWGGGVRCWRVAIAAIGGVVWKGPPPYGSCMGSQRQSCVAWSRGAPPPLRYTVLCKFSARPCLHTHRAFVMCSDAAMDGIRYRGGAYIPGLPAVRSSVMQGNTRNRGLSCYCCCGWRGLQLSWIGGFWFW